MLTGQYNLARYKNGIVFPYHLAGSSKNLRLASNLIELFQAGTEKKRYELDEEIKALYVEKVNPKIVQGMAKLLFDRCEFSDYGESDPQSVRQEVFTASANYWTTSPSLKSGLLNHKQQILEAAGVSAQSAYQETDSWLFGDVAGNRVLKEFQPINDSDLISRFNIEQIQGLLLHAEKMELRLRAMKDSSFRQIMQMLKFFQLMFQVTEADKHWLSITIDGPGSILENARSYGLEIANFFPAILLLSVPWNMTTTLKVPSRKRRFKLELSHENDLNTFYQTKGVWNHERALGLIQRFNEKYSDEMEASAENHLIALSNNRYLIPDIVIKDKQTNELYMVEWIHYLTESKIKQLDMLKEELPGKYLFALKGKKNKLEQLRKKLGQQVLIFAKDLTAPALYKTIKKQTASN